MSAPHAALSAATDERKARLAKLRSLKRKQPEDEVVAPESDRAPSPPSAPSPVPAPHDDHGDGADRHDRHASPPEKEVARLHLSGRNYDPDTRGPKLGFEAPPTLGAEEETLEAQAAELEAEVRRRAEEDARDDRGIDLFKLQPKKPNWDLKRELNRKLEVLNVRTDNAIARLVRERLSAKKAGGAQDGGAGGSGSGGGGGGGGSNSSSGGAPAKDGSAGGALEGAELVEGLRVREQEEEEELRREREAEELDMQ